MEVKIDTKEKFHVLTLLAPVLSDNIAAHLTFVASPFLQHEIKNIVLNLSNTDTIDGETAAGQLVQLQQSFYEQNASFVVCCLTKQVEQQLEAMELLEIMNVTPTESEAWDIVQMEEIERELLDGEENGF